MDQKSSLLDRSYQNEVLAFLLKDYPEYEHTDAFCSDLLIKNDLKYYANLMYLEMHELIEDGPSCGRCQPFFPLIYKVLHLCFLRGSAPSAFGGFPRGFFRTTKMFATALCGLSAVRRLSLCDRLHLTQLPVFGV